MFANWTENGTVVSTSGSYTFTANGSRNLVANFTSQQSTGPWAKGFGGSSYNYGRVVAVEPITGNTVFAGYFAGTTDFGGGLLTSAGSMNMVLGKYSPAGGCLWSKRFGSTGTEMPTAVALDASGNIFVAGIFQGTADVGGGPMVSAGSDDIFVAKYSPAGQYLWG